MPSLQVRELPEPVYRKLSELAHKEHRSISQQATIILARGLFNDENSQGKRKSIIEEIRSQGNELRKYHLKDPVELIREERDR